jgi:hypothetical protein
VKSTATRRPCWSADSGAHGESFSMSPLRLSRRWSQVACRRRRQERTHSLHQLAVGKTANHIAKPNQSSQNRPDLLFAKTQSRRIQTIFGGGWSGHLAKGGHIRSRLSICRFGVTETPVGRLANRPQGIPVLRTDSTSDSEIDDSLDDGKGVRFDRVGRYPGDRE